MMANSDLDHGDHLAEVIDTYADGYRRWPQDYVAFGGEAGVDGGAIGAAVRRELEGVFVEIAQDDEEPA